ncbi:MAG: DNA repair protein RadA [Deinococcales bacterium]|nr:DNA repair protein RadA [Deinococcales bacterium]
MAKSVTTYVCSECGTHSPAYLGRCPRCGSWGTLEEERSAAPTARGGRAAAARRLATTRLEEVLDASLSRRSSGDAEVDRVLGGGWVLGSALLIAGEPGIGKSTLLLQLAQHAVEAGRSVLYVAGEESPAQVRMRADRLGLGSGMELTRENDARVIAEHVRAVAPDLVIVDSIQTLVDEDGAVPGTVSQLRDSTALLVDAAKGSGSTLVLIGHVTKQGSIAGPKVIEHVVDATFALESAAGLRVLRSMKNRFGATGEVGVFEMTQSGMQAVKNPSEAFLAERPRGVPGSVVVAALEGQRPLLLEVQALASKSPYAAPRRVVQGLDHRRVDVVLAVLERRLQLPLDSLDVYVNVAGGLRLTDPGADLAVAVAVHSAVTNRPAPDGTALVGEVGLAGELRSVGQLARRLEEARRADHPRLIGPRSRELPDGVRTLQQALALLWGDA